MATTLPTLILKTHSLMRTERGRKPKRDLPCRGGPARSVFLMIQVGYLVMYCTTLYYADAVESVLRGFEAIPVVVTLPAVVVTAMCGIAVRLYLVSSVGFSHPAAGEKFQKLFPGSRAAGWAVGCIASLDIQPDRCRCLAGGRGRARLRPIFPTDSCPERLPSRRLKVYKIPLLSYKTDKPR